MIREISLNDLPKSKQLTFYVIRTSELIVHKLLAINFVVAEDGTVTDAKVAASVHPA